MHYNLHVGDEHVLWLLSNRIPPLGHVPLECTWSLWFD